MKTTKHKILITVSMKECEKELSVTKKSGTKGNFQKWQEKSEIIKKWIPEKWEKFQSLVIKNVIQLQWKMNIIKMQQWWWFCVLIRVR